MNSSTHLTVLVHTIRLEAKGIISVEFRSPADEELPPFSAGSHIDLHLPNGLVRSYSLFNSPSERHRYVIGVLNERNSRGGSRYVHEHLRVDSTIEIAPPRNNFELEESAVKSVLLAGGIGITPIFCMYNRLRTLGKSVELIYCARTKKEAAFINQLSASDTQIKMHFDDEQGGPPNLAKLLSSASKNTHFYCCGPTPMLNAFESTCAEYGYTNVHIERFAAAGEVETSQNSGYQVHLAKSGQTVNVAPGISLLDALLEAGVDADYSCREGICGACETAVLEGTPDHRDSVLTEDERESNKTMMVCVSGCKGSKLVLDI